MIGKRVRVFEDDENSWVELLDLMPSPATGLSPDLAVVNAARVSYGEETRGEELDKKLLFYLMRNRHTTPFEMVEFKFRVRAPLVVWWQWYRHRTFSYNSQSGRYTPFYENDFYVPSKWLKQSKVNKQSSDGVLEAEQGIIDALPQWVKDHLNIKEDATLSDALRNYATLGFEVYKAILGGGGSREQARLFLPGFAAYYTVVVKVDAHNLMNFLRLRLAQESQFEIRAYANVIYKDFFKVHMPWTAEAFELWGLK